MSASLQVPISVSAKTPQDLTRAMLQVQAKENGKVSIITIYFDGTNHICWYLPVRSLGAGVL